MTLTRNLTNCPDNGLVIGADDITVDLNGHTTKIDRKVSAPDLDRPNMKNAVRQAPRTDLRAN